MCDMSEEEWPEYLLQVEAAVARARVPRRSPATPSVESVEPSLVAVEAHA